MKKIALFSLLVLSGSFFINTVLAEDTVLHIKKGEIVSERYEKFRVARQYRQRGGGDRLFPVIQRNFNANQYKMMQKENRAMEQIRETKEGVASNAKVYNEKTSRLKIKNRKNVTSQKFYGHSYKAQVRKYYLEQKSQK